MELQLVISNLTQLSAALEVLTSRPHTIGYLLLGSTCNKDAQSDVSFKGPV